MKWKLLFDGFRYFFLEYSKLHAEEQLLLVTSENEFIF